MKITITGQTERWLKKQAQSWGHEPTSKGVRGYLNELANAALVKELKAVKDAQEALQIAAELQDNG